MRQLSIAIAILVFCTPFFAQTSPDEEEFANSRILITRTKSFTPPNGYVPDKATAIAVAYAVALPIYGQKMMDGEMPFRASLKDGVWTVLGTLHCEHCVGGTLVMQINKNTGKILFLTHTM